MEAHRLLREALPARCRRVTRGLWRPLAPPVDGASAGPFSWLITPWGGHYPPAVVLHDWFYVLLDAGVPDACARTRKEADNASTKS